jgi:HlyD family secretion protein
MKTVIITFLCVLLSGGAIAWYRYDTGPALPPLRTLPVERGDLLFTIGATGTVEPEEVVDVGAQVAGKIISLGADPRNSAESIDYRSPVKEGTVLALIDDALYQSEVEQAKANVDSARALVESSTAQVSDAEANVERAKKDLLQMQARLYKAKRDWGRADLTWKNSQGAITESDLDLARSTYEAADAAVGVGAAAISQATAQVAVAKAAVAKANADLASAQATLKRAQINLGYCTIKSPVEGVIIDRRVNIGQTVVSSFNSPSLFLIAKDVKKMQIWASVNEADIGHIHPGQEVKYSVENLPGKMRTGVVAPDNPRWNASMNQNVVTYTVVVETDNSNGELTPYITADMEFQVAEHKGVLIVPNTALRWRPSPARVAASGLSTALVGGPDGVAKTGKAGGDSDDLPGAEGTIWILENNRLRPVNVHQLLSDGTRTEVAAAELSEGMSVVVGEAAVATAGEAADPFSPKIFGGGKSSKH